MDIGDDVRFFGIPLIQQHPGSSISISNAVTVTSAARYTALGVTQRTLVRTVLPGATIGIGSDTGLSGAVVVAAKEIEIGRRCLIGAGAMLVDTDFHPVVPRGGSRRYASIESADSEPVDVGDDVFIGARAILLKGTRIGEGSVVGAGAVVNGDWPARSIIAGNPARLIGELDGQDTLEELAPLPKQAPGPKRAP